MAATATASPHAHHQQVVQNWDELWAVRPTDARDNELLAREQAFKRWALVRENIVQTYGAVSGIRAIELGSGRGDLSALLAKEGASVTLLDSSERALTQARHRFDRLGLAADFQQGDLFRPINNMGQFDVAISSGVIEHFDGEQRSCAIQAHAAVVKRGGLVIISVPNAHCMPYRVWKRWLEFRGCWPYGFEKPFTRRELIRRAHAVGLKRVEVSGCGFAQSWNDQFLPLMTGCKPARKCNQTSRFDERMGLALVLFAWKS